MNAPSMRTPDEPRLSVLGVEFLDVTMDAAIARLSAIIAAEPRQPHSVFFVNAHTLNVAAEDPAYRDVLQAADFVFGDGTGVRWAARMLYGIRIKDNVNGTDFTPKFFRANAGKGYRYYLLGATAEAIEKAAARTQELFPGWQLCGYHDGYLDDAKSERVIEQINAAAPHLLLVGMGNPLQERWIHRYKSRLSVPLCLGVGGLFTYWSGDLVRAPTWVRRLGYEWLHLLISQPHKFQRYVFGSPTFLARVARERVIGRARGASHDHAR